MQGKPHARTRGFQAAKERTVTMNGRFVEFGLSMSASTPTPSAPLPPGKPAQIDWPDAQRQQAFTRWITALAPAHSLQLASLRPASADASFRRYLRLDSANGSSLIVMDAPPDKENCRPFVQV